MEYGAALEETVESGLGGGKIYMQGIRMSKKHHGELTPTPKGSNTGGVLGSHRMSDIGGQKTGENNFTDWGIPPLFWYDTLLVLCFSLDTELDRALTDPSPYKN